VSVHTTLLVGWSGTLAFLAAWFTLLSRLRPDESLFRIFARYAMTGAGAMLSTAALFSAPDAAFAMRARSFQIAAFGLAVYLLPDIVRGLTQRPVATGPPRVVGASFAVLAASGVFVNPVGGGGFTPLGQLAGLILLASITPATATLAHVSLTARGFGFVAAALAFALVGGLADLVRLVVGEAPLELGAHAIGFATLAIGATLMRRVVQAEEELERSSKELARSLEELQTAERALVEARSRAALGELAAVIAHEVRNPLAVLRNAASSLRKPTTSSVDIETLVEIIQEETRRLDQLGRSLARYAEPMPYRPERLALDALFRDVAAAVRRANDGASAAAQIHVEPTDELALADPALLRQALVNVIDNAVRAMPGGGRALVRAVPSENAIRIEVTDEGEGMSDAVLARARDPFFTTRATGTGLGLALVDKVVRLHGGELALQRNEPRGTLVAITLPRP
jgi:signal transduction histidine kinase